jgi:hypothetical protein
MSEEQEPKSHYDKDWTPGYGTPYFEEPVFYVSPKVKDSTFNERIDVPNSYITKDLKFYSDQEIHAIWEKPLEKYELSEEEIETLKTEPEKANSVLYMTEESPCKAHILNRKLDRCYDQKVGRSNKSMLRYHACVTHIYKFLKCQNKHRPWYELRLKEVNKYLTTPLTLFELGPAKIEEL